MEVSSLDIHASSDQGRWSYEIGQIPKPEWPRRGLAGPR
jgi:hypothetical protein